MFGGDGVEGGGDLADGEVAEGEVVEEGIGGRSVIALEANLESSLLISLSSSRSIFTKLKLPVSRLVVAVVVVIDVVSVFIVVVVVVVVVFVVILLVVAVLLLAIVVVIVVDVGIVVILGLKVPISVIASASISSVDDSNKFKTSPKKLKVLPCPLSVLTGWKPSVSISSTLVEILSVMGIIVLTSSAVNVEILGLVIDGRVITGRVIRC